MFIFVTRKWGCRCEVTTLIKFSICFQSLAVVINGIDFGLEVMCFSCSKQSDVIKGISKRKNKSGEWRQKGMLIETGG